MELIVTLGFGANLLAIAWVWNRIDARLTALEKQVEAGRPSARLVGAARATKGAPRVDARARTTRRDTDDLPRTGRQSKTLNRSSTDDS